MAIGLADKLHSGPCKESGSSVCMRGTTLAELEKSTNPTIKGALSRYKASPKEAADQLKLLSESIPVLGHSKVNTDIKKYKPVGELKESYLSNFHEDAILQFVSEIISDGFHPIPVSLMDFPEPSYDYSGTHLRDFFKQHKKKIGKDIKTAACVLNTLRSTGNLKEVGHWVAMFMDFRKDWTIEYYDSAGNPPKPAVWKWMNDEPSSHNLPIKAYIASDLRSQKGETECGMYALYYICCRLQGISMKAFRVIPIPDAEVTEFRKYVMIEAPEFEQISHNAYLTH